MKSKKVCIRSGDAGRPPREIWSSVSWMGCFGACHRRRCCPQRGRSCACRSACTHFHSLFV